MSKRSSYGKKRYYTLIFVLAVLIAAFVYSTATKTSIHGGVALEERAKDALRVHYIDVGQGDSELIELPNDEVMLIDAGENDKGGLVADYIRSQGIDKIDYLVGTHPHSDHIGGLDTVIDELEIGKIYMPKASSDTKTFSDVLDAVERKGLSVNSAKAGVEILNDGDLSVTFVAPVREAYKSLNNVSAIVKIVYKGSSFLFTGDAEEQAEGDITADVRADILKVGHHGSSTSSSWDFLDRVKPSCAVISCGEGNDYGHPHTETLEKLSDIGAAVYRTDLDGTVIIETQGDGYTVYTENSEENRGDNNYENQRK